MCVQARGVTFRLIVSSLAFVSWHTVRKVGVQGEEAPAGGGPAPCTAQVPGGCPAGARDQGTRCRPLR